MVQSCVILDPVKKRHAPTKNGLEFVVSGWEPPEPIMRVLRELVVRGHAPTLQAAAEGLMMLGLPSVQARLERESAPPAATPETPPKAAFSPDPAMGSLVPRDIASQIRTFESTVRLPNDPELKADTQGEPSHLNVSPGMTERPTGALPRRDGTTVVLPGHAPYPRVYTNPSVAARAQARGYTPVVPAGGVVQAPGPKETEKSAQTELDPQAKYARIRAQEAPGGVFRAARESWEGSLQKNVLARLLRMRLHPAWPTDIYGRAWLRAPVDKTVLTGWCAGNFLWRGLPEHTAVSQAGAFQVSFGRARASCVFVCCDGTVYPELVYRAWLWCPADPSGVLVGW